MNLREEAKRLNVNPYYLVYALENGFKTCKEAFDFHGHNAYYFSWNNKRWIELKDRIGVSQDLQSHLFHEEYMVYLQERIDSLELNH